MFFKIWIKLKLKDFQITWANILLKYFIEKISQLNIEKFHWEMLPFYPLNELISKCDGLNSKYRSQKSWHGGNKRLKKQEI